MTLAPALRNWSERSDPNSPKGAWRDCSQCSCLMVLLYGGATIPNAYTVGEREHFEDNEGLPEYVTGAPAGTVQETGLLNYRPCDKASQKLYGVAAHAGADGFLGAQLNQPGLAFALTGMGAGLPSGTIVPHSICVVTRGDGGLWLYDPVRAMGNDPETVAITTILAWHRRLPNDIRWVRAGEFKEPDMQPVILDPAFRIGILVLTDAHYAFRLDNGQTVGPYPAGMTWDVFASGKANGADSWLVVPGDQKDAAGNPVLCAEGKAAGTFASISTADPTALAAAITAAVDQALATQAARVKAALE